MVASGNCVGYGLLIMSRGFLSRFVSYRARVGWRGGGSGLCRTRRFLLDTRHRIQYLPRGQTNNVSMGHTTALDREGPKPFELTRYLSTRCRCFLRTQNRGNWLD